MFSRLLMILSQDIETAANKFSSNDSDKFFSMCLSMHLVEVYISNLAVTLEGEGQKSRC